MVYVDGLAEPTNPGVGGWGFSVLKEGKEILSGRGCLGWKRTNNEAEYSSVLAALDELERLGIKDEEIIIRSDSMLLVRQLSGEWQVRGGAYVPKFLEATERLRRFPRVRFEWIPRKENGRADSLSREAYKKWCVEQGMKPRFRLWPVRCSQCVHFDSAKQCSIGLKPRSAGCRRWRQRRG